MHTPSPLTTTAMLILTATVTLAALTAPRLQQSQPPLATIERQPETPGPEAAPANAAFEAGNWTEAARLFGDLTKAHPDVPQYAMRYAVSLHRSGDLKGAIPAHERAASFPRLRTTALFNLACAHALLKNPDAAMTALRLAVGSGFENAEQLQEDADLASLRERDDFKALVASLAQPPLPPVTWDTLEQRMDAEAARGFSGAVLVRRDNKIVLSKGYGLADRGRKIPCTDQTIFAIGSTPIDFTKASLLLLAERGQLDLSAPITKFFDNVPADKQTITVTHLMTGRSGLPDFLGLPSDPDPDHFYIDRTEAMRRIFASPLLFEPGTKSVHSHAAWGVLTAIVEIVSGQTYEEFTKKNLFDPAGMRDTGPFGQSDPAGGTGVPPVTGRSAIGYGQMTDGKENSPPYWGPTSWLVKGSGGMVSTVTDMDRYLVAMREHRILNEKSTTRYFARSRGLLSGGDVFGFEILYSQGPDNYMILITNAGERRAHFDRLGEELGQLVGAFGGPPPPFMIGVQFQPKDGHGVEVVGVNTDGGGAAAGLILGDILTAVDAQPVTDDAFALLLPHLQDGSPMKFDILRGSEKLTLTVTPKPRPPQNP